MMRLTTSILATLILTTQLLRAAPEELNTLTLDQAIALALENNRSLKNASLNIAKAQNQVAASRTYRLPSLNSYVLGARELSHADLTFDKGALGILPGVGPVPAQDTTIRSSGRFSALIVNEVTQPISQLHRIGLSIHQAEIGVEMAALQLRTEQHSVVAGVKGAYYSILQTQSSLRAAEQNIRLYRELDRLTEEYVLQRVSLKSESLEIKTRLAKAELDAMSLQDVMASQKEQLNALLGRRLETDMTVQLPSEAALVGIDLR